MVTLSENWTVGDANFWLRSDFPPVNIESSRCASHILIPRDVGAKPISVNEVMTNTVRSDCTLKNDKIRTIANAITKLSAERRQLGDVTRGRAKASSRDLPSPTDRGR